MMKWILDHIETKFIRSVKECNFLTVSILALVSTVPYLPGLSHHFVFDDVPGVKNNQDVRASSPIDIFKHDFWGANISSSRSHKESI